MLCISCRFCDPHENEDLSVQATFTCKNPINMGYIGILHGNGCPDGEEAA